MTESKWALTPPFTGIVARDVVAGLTAADGAHAVARAAVKEAAVRGARVRFLHVVSPDTPAAEREAGDSGMFAGALRALREFPRVPVTFEVAEGEPGPVLVERSTDASILVIAAEEPDDAGDAAPGPSPRPRGDATRPGAGLAAPLSAAAYCHRHATCDVLTVRVPRLAESGLASSV